MKYQDNNLRLFLSISLDSREGCKLADMLFNHTPGILSQMLQSCLQHPYGEQDYHL